jgi:type IV pilus assembly protein PilB
MNAIGTTSTRKRIGELLVESGVITLEQLENSLLLQKGKNKRLGKILVELGYITEDQVAETLSRQLALPLVDCAQFKPTKEILSLVPRTTAEKKLVFPLEVKERRLSLAMANPLDWQTVDELAFSTGMNIAVAVASESSIMNAIEEHYSSGDDLLKFLKDVPINEKVEFIRGIAPERTDEGRGRGSGGPTREISEDAPIVKFVAMVLLDAAKSRASDIHIEPGEKDIQVRYRIDGELKNMLKYPGPLHDSVVTRIKIISDLDITNRRLPQDGRMLLRVEGKDIDIRISTLPSVYGEKLVLRLLDHATGLVPLAKLGIPQTTLKPILTMISQPQGMILVTGPTGSGKTTSLYALLQQLRAETKNIITIEDPVEYRVPGTTQVGINEPIGLSFPNILRSVLRQDPDIIMIGEVRDLDTAEIATRAALTGHLVLSTLHTNDTVATITRLIDIGLEPYLVSSAVTGIIAQRLVRRICPKCKVEIGPPEEVADLELPPIKKAFKGTGCKDCQFTGFMGRVGAYELLILNVSLKRLIAKGAPEGTIREVAIKSGMVTLFEDAWSKVVQGITTVDEVLSKVPLSKMEPETRAALDAGQFRQALLVNVPEEDGLVVRSVLEQAGFDVKDCRGRDAFEEALARAVDLCVVFADEKLPGVMERLRKNVRHMSVPVLILTDTVSEQLVNLGARWGIRGVSQRPVQAVQFTSLIREALKD